MRSLGRVALGVALIVALLCSCLRKKSVFDAQATPHHFQELRQASDLMETHPGQALQLLEECAETSGLEDWSEVERHEYQVLTAEAQYKTGAFVADGVPLEAAVEFFDSVALGYPEDGTLRFLLAKSYYYLGAENTSIHNDVDAASLFVTALKTAWAGLEAKDAEQTRFKGLCHYRLGEILYNYNIQASALQAFDSARFYFDRVNDTLGVAACIRSAGEVYLASKGYECALARFKEANRLWDFGDSWYDHAIGGLFFEHQQLDSARVYLERSFVTGGPYTRIDAAAKLAEIWRERGDPEKENYYTLFYVQNTIREANRSFDKMEIEFIYDGLKQTTSPAESRPFLTLHVLFIIVLVLAGIALMAFIIFRNRHRITHIEQQLSVIEKSHRKVPKDKRQPVERPQTPSIDFDSALECFLNTPVTLKIRKSLKGKDIMTKSVGLYPKLKLTEVDFIEVVSAANSCFPDCSSHLLRDFGELSTADVRHCCLALMGLNDAEIAVLEGITYSGANRRTKRILSVMDNGSGLEEAVLLYLKSIYK